MKDRFEFAGETIRQATS